MHVSRYHKFLRVSLLAGTLALIFVSGLISPTTKILTDHTASYLAAVGGASMNVAVPPNEVNSLSAELAAYERELSARDAALREREIKARDYDTSTTDYGTYVLSAILFIIMVLMVLNYVMDWMRFKRLIEMQHEQKTA